MSKRTPGPWKVCRRQRVGPNHTRYTVLCIGYEGEYRSFAVAELGRADNPEPRQCPFYLQVSKRIPIRSQYENESRLNPGCIPQVA